MKKRLKGLYLVIYSLVICLFNLPFALAKTAAGNRLTNTNTLTRKTAVNAITPVAVRKSVYDSLYLNLKGLKREVFELAKKGYERLVDQGKLKNDSIISIVDLSQASTQKRLYVLDLRNYKVLFNSLVAHGRNSGLQYATRFSNQHSSYMSSPGFYVTGGTYEGKNGYSLKLDGMERGINDNAFERGIVVHGAPYVSDAFVNAQGYSGRSQGCPAVPVQTSKPLINTIKNGSCMFIYHPTYVDNSKILSSPY